MAQSRATDIGRRHFRGFAGSVQNSTVVAAPVSRRWCLHRSQGQRWFQVQSETFIGGCGRSSFINFDLWCLKFLILAGFERIVFH